MSEKRYSLYSSQRVADHLRLTPPYLKLRSAPFGLVCFVGTMGVLEYRNWQGVKGKFEDVSESCACLCQT